MITSELEHTLNYALTFAKEEGHEYATLEHLLLALTDDKDARKMFQSFNINISELQFEIIKFIEEKLTNLISENLNDPSPTLGFQRVIQKALLSAQSLNKSPVNGVHVLAAMLGEKDSYAAYLLDKYKINKLEVLSYISNNFSKISPQIKVRIQEANPEGKPIFKEGEPAVESPLKTYCVNLNEKAQKGKIDPIIGREEEIERMVEILCRRSKNNPLLVGEAGVGKTALASGLALRISQNQVPKALEKSVIYSLDMGGLLAGTRYRGDFEERFKSIVSALEKEPEAILFIDEIHTVIGAGATTSGATDASGLLKPVLSSGDIRCIGACTYKEYRNHFEKDRALLRRFQKIDINEPSINETFEILKGLKSFYEKHHGVKYSEEVLYSAALLAKRHINEGKLPDKAIDVIDEAGSKKKLNSKTSKGNLIISIKDIEHTVAKIARIPASSVTKEEKDLLKNIEKSLKKAVFGQDEAIDILCSQIKLARSGLREEGKPIGCYLFSGPTGVGKTEVAKQLALSLGVELKRFDMSEYMEKHSVSRLIGTPPGYVGFEQGGLLTDTIDQNPHCVLLLDELEKAHPDLYSILLQVMDYGKLTDSNGKTVDFSNVILIMTTNAGASDLSKPPLGFFKDKREGEDKDAIEKLFSPEFRNRLDAIIPFKSLEEKIIEKVVDKFMHELSLKLKDKKVSIKTTKDARELIAKQGFDSNNGARPLSRVIQEYIKKPLSEELLFGSLTKGGDVTVGVKNGKIVIITDKEQA